MAASKSASLRRQLSTLAWTALASAGLAGEAGGAVSNPPTGYIDVLYVFTPGAEAYAAGHGGREPFAHKLNGIGADLMRGTSNLGANGAQFRVCGVHTEGVPDTWSMQQFRDYLAPSRTTMHPNVRQVMDSLKCDMVVGLTRQTQGGGLSRIAPICGGMASVSDIARWGAPNFTWLHELLHNIGAGHQRNLGNGVFEFSHGWCNPNGPRDMSTTSSSACNGNRVLTLSGTHTYDGWPMGNASNNNAETVSIRWKTIRRCRVKAGSL